MLLRVLRDSEQVAGAAAASVWTCTLFDFQQVVDFQYDNTLLPAETWFAAQGWEVFPFQRDSWCAWLAGASGIIHAPTGSGKTYAAFLGVALQALQEPAAKGLRLLWITPVRALAREITDSCQRAVEGLGLPWRVEMRTGDTPAATRSRQKAKPPQVLVTTPESLHLLFCQQNHADYFAELRGIVCDEWHELVGSKRGVLMELALMQLRRLRPGLQTWAISATIGNPGLALQLLAGSEAAAQAYRIIRAPMDKRYALVTLIPPTMARFPWRGHLGLHMIDQLLPVLAGSRSSLVFTNTRAQCEAWYQALLEADPMLAGEIAMHHSSLSREIRDWVEENLHSGRLRVVVCTSSLDLGVDFRPVETVIQVGSPKGVARFLQRAGRSGHQPGAVSRIYLLPTHALEIMEGAALRNAIDKQRIEPREPYWRSFDVLLQFLVTLAVGDGFRPASLLPHLRETWSYASLRDEEWAWCLDFIRAGGKCFSSRDEYHKVTVDETGLWRVSSRLIAKKHRMNIGVILSENLLPVAFQAGKMLGHVEEGFIAQLKPGDTFLFAGRCLEFLRIRDMTAIVRASTANKGKIPSWAGGRMPLSSSLAAEIRALLDEAARGQWLQPEMEGVRSLLALQQQRSALPRADELLVEYFQDQEGYHLLCYPFEGRFVHEGLSALLAYRISCRRPITFSMAVNDYGFELLSDQPLPVGAADLAGLLSTEGLGEDIRACINQVEMARRRFREIATVAGLVFKGFPGKQAPDRHLQASAGLFFSVFSSYEPDSLLLQQAYEEVLTFQLEEGRLRQAMERINSSRLVYTQPKRATPFAFPIIVDRLRERLSSEKLEDRIKRMTFRLEKDS